MTTYTTHTDPPLTLELEEDTFEDGSKTYAVTLIGNNRKGLHIGSDKAAAEKVFADVKAMYDKRKAAEKEGKK